MGRGLGRAVFSFQWSVLSKERDEYNAEAPTGRLSAIRYRRSGSEKKQENDNAPTGPG